MRRRLPAIVYTVGASAKTIAYLNDDLGAAGLFQYDHFEESPEHTDVSVLERPQLGRAIVDVALSVAGIRDEGAGPGHVLVVDRIEDLGPSALERAAVVSAIQHMGCEIRAGGSVVPQRWYQDQVAALGFRPIDEIAQELVTSDRLERTIGAWWSELGGPANWIPSETGRHARVRDRIRQLVDEEGLSFTAVATRLMNEGYANPYGNPVWYTQNVRRAYEAGR